jgi:alanyl-tRNA synthetase
VTSVLQGVISNYDTDLFTPLIKRAAELTSTKASADGTKHVGTAAPGRPAERDSPSPGVRTGNRSHHDVQISVYKTAKYKQKSPAR